MASASQEPPAVRFSSHNEEIEPAAAVASLSAEDRLSPEAEEQIRSTISSSLSQSQDRYQARRMENFSFEPVSLPASRAPSPSPASRTPSGHSVFRNSHGSNRPSPPASALHSPPLTPAGTSSHDGRGRNVGDHRKGAGDAAMMTPQVSPPHGQPPPTSMDATHDERTSRFVADNRSPRESAPPSPRFPPASDMAGGVGPHPRQPPTFTVGPAGDSIPPSRDTSPSGSAGVRTPGGRTSGTSTPNYGRPYTPSGEKDDPYARSKRPPQPRNLDSLEARFIFGGRDRKHRHYSPPTSSTSLPHSKGSSTDLSSKDDKKSIRFEGTNKHLQAADDKSMGKQHHHGSMAELKRFFKLGHKHKDKKEKEKERGQSPAPSVKPEKAIRSSKKSGYMTPPRAISQGSVAVPFADDHGLEQKYGRFGKVLGSGAGGSVRLLKRSDGVTFAVKQFRARHSYESEKDYNKKVTAEFCIGSTLHHGNIIETMDLVNEKGNYYVVMEYAPFDLFAIVMTGKMSREEVSCCTLQILNGVTYLHRMGLAHRDLKLDNVVVNERGIMKIIDFGSAAVFRYPFENEIVLASGIVGSDPYLAPEVYDVSKYDPQPADIWSLAIIFCCMTLRRFPWKAPRVTDNSYKLFVAPPNDGPKSITQPSSGSHSEAPSRNPSTGTPTSETPGEEKQPPAVIKGPWRLLRLLPRESRHIVGRMLEIDPKKRATLDEILNDKWILNSQVCSQEEGGRVINVENHEHTLEGSAGVTSAPPTKQK